MRAYNADGYYGDSGEPEYYSPYDGGIASAVPLNMAAPPAVPMQTSTDPYAAIRSLDPSYFSSYQVERPATGWGGNRGNGDVPTDGNGNPLPGVMEDRYRINEDALLADPSLRAFQSKFNSLAKDANGNYNAVFQAPGKDKYDLLNASYKLDPATGKYTLIGDPSAYRQQSGLTEGLQMIGQGASMLAAPVALGPLAGALGGGILGGAGAGALLGAGGSLLGGGNRQDAIRSGVVGGIGGGIYGYNNPMPGGMSGPDLNWDDTLNTTQNLGQPLPGYSSGIASAPPQQLTPAALESAIGTPGYGVNASADNFLESAGSPNLSGVNANVPEEYLVNGNWNSSGTIAPTTAPDTQTIEVTGKGNPAPAPTTPTAAPATTATPDPTDYSNEGRNYPTPESTQGPGGSPVNASTTPSLMDKFGEFMKSNPRLALSLLGAIGGKIAGGKQPTPTGSGQAGFTATQAPKFQRQYVAPPAGYRPGFDPEHKYFTGIGNTGTGG